MMIYFTFSDFFCSSRYSFSLFREIYQILSEDWLLQNFLSASGVGRGCTALVCLNIVCLNSCDLGALLIVFLAMWRFADGGVFGWFACVTYSVL